MKRTLTLPGSSIREVVHLNTEFLRGFISCMVFDALFAVVNVIIESAFLLREKRKVLKNERSTNN